VLTVRVSPELHDQLLAYKFFTKKSINELAVHLLSEYLEGPGADEMVKAMGERAGQQYAVALEKLA
jgi:hypothetical protein